MKSFRADQVDPAIWNWIRLQRERASLAAQLQARQLTAEQIESLKRYAAQVAERLDAAENDFAARRRIIEMLDVQATLTVEDGQKVAYVRCFLQEEDANLSIASQSSYKTVLKRQNSAAMSARLALRNRTLSQTAVLDATCTL